MLTKNGGCPLCEVISNPATRNAGADSVAMFGIVICDILSIHKIAKIICEAHRNSLADYYDLLHELHEQDIEEMKKNGTYVSPVPDKTSN